MAARTPKRLTNTVRIPPALLKDIDAEAGRKGCDPRSLLIWMLKTEIVKFPIPDSVIIP